MVEKEPTIIYLDADWRIRYGSLNWMLERRVQREKKSGEKYEDWEIKGYYGDLGFAARRWLRSEIQELGLTSLAKLLLALVQAEERVTKAVEEALRGRRTP